MQSSSDKQPLMKGSETNVHSSITPAQSIPNQNTFPVKQQIFRQKKKKKKQHMKAKPSILIILYYIGLKL